MIAALIGIWLAMLAAGGTATGRAMRRWLVEAPARWLSGWARGQLITLALALAGALLVITVMERDGIMLMGMYAPDMLMVLASVEFTSAVEVATMALLTATTMRLSVVRAWIATRLAPRSRTPRARRVRRGKPPANDDGPGWAPGWGLPLAA